VVLNYWNTEFHTASMINDCEFCRKRYPRLLLGSFNDGVKAGGMVG
jgi:hypothetical protein